MAHRKPLWRPKKTGRITTREILKINGVKINGKTAKEVKNSTKTG